MINYVHLLMIRKIIKYIHINFKLFLDEFTSHLKLRQGLRGKCLSPLDSIKPNIIFIFCTAWPAAPSTRLSITDTVMLRCVRSSYVASMSQKLYPPIFFSAG